MSVIRHLDKNDPSQRARLTDLFLSSDFLLLPTRAESYGIVFCEASAFGLLSVTTATGGVPTIVRDGENGALLPLDAGPDDYATVIRRLYEQPDELAALSASSRAAFETRLNWDTWAALVIDELSRL